MKQQQIVHPLETMSPAEVLTYLRGIEGRLTRKKARERAYLDRRASYGRYTKTDATMEEDQLLLEEVLSLLKMLGEQYRQDMGL